jgi:hypothetical protein
VNRNSLKDAAVIQQNSPTRSFLVPGYVATMLLSACLLFLVQPMFARMALPLLGGTPAVWAIAMCFFQAMLLGGYAYAHVLKKYVAPRLAVLIHVALLACAWLFLPVAIPQVDVPASGPTAGVWLVGLMARAIGFPFFMLSATAPLLQSWFARTAHQDSENPYFLYSASNIGSIGALMLYPFFIEPAIGLHAQSLLWSIGYGILTVAIALCGLLMLGNFKPMVVGWGIAPTLAVPFKTKAYWVFMAFIPSALLVAWTNHITTDIASAPFLWLPPLVLFLLTFVLVFRDVPLVSLHWAKWIQIASLPIAYAVQIALPLHIAVWVMLVGALSFFSTALICHRQLYEARPDASKLTEFYMLMSLGGVLGGLFVSLIAPLIFTSVLEYPILLVLGAAAQFIFGSGESIMAQIRKPWRMGAVLAGLLGLVGFAILTGIAGNLMNPIKPRVAYRSYFGVLSVADNTIEGPYRVLTHGTTMHGAQRMDELGDGFKDKPHALTYYSPDGGMARALLATQARLQNGVYRVVGLGTGSLACYSKPGEDWAYYEIDRDVIKVARDPAQFNFLSKCAPDMKMIEGDARITMAHGPDVKADYLLVDAFSSDSIPIHLITVEAMKLYLSHIKDDGVLVMHVTNRYMDLVPVVAANLAAIDPALQGRVVDFVPAVQEVSSLHSIAIVMSKNPAALAELDKAGGTTPLTALAGIDPWTDDFSNLFSAIMRRVRVTKY